MTEKVQLIDKANDVSAFASTDPTRPAINGIFTNGKGTQATDGRVAIRVPYVEIDPEEFPAIEGVTNQREAVILPVKPLQEALKTVHKCNLPVLGCARLSTVKRGESTRAQLATTDLDNSRVVESRVIEGDYPKIDQIWPEQEPQLTIALGAVYLKRVAEYALKHGAIDTGTCSPSIRFRFIDALTPVCFEIRLADGRKVEGVLAPVRLS